jgi:hypothetical protein
MKKKTAEETFHKDDHVLVTNDKWNEQNGEVGEGTVSSELDEQGNVEVAMFNAGGGWRHFPPSWLKKASSEKTSSVKIAGWSDADGNQLKIGDRVQELEGRSDVGESAPTGVITYIDQGGMATVTPDDPNEHEAEIDCENLRKIGVRKMATINIGETVTDPDGEEGEVIGRKGEMVSVKYLDDSTKDWFEDDLQYVRQASKKADRTNDISSDVDGMIERETSLSRDQMLAVLHDNNPDVPPYELEKILDEKLKKTGGKKAKDSNGDIVNVGDELVSPEGSRYVIKELEGNVAILQMVGSSMSEGFGYAELTNFTLTGSREASLKVAKALTHDEVMMAIDELKNIRMKLYDTPGLDGGIYSLNDAITELEELSDGIITASKKIAVKFNRDEQVSGIDNTKGDGYLFGDDKSIKEQKREEEKRIKRGEWDVQRFLRASEMADRKGNVKEAEALLALAEKKVEEIRQIKEASEES